MRIPEKLKNLTMLDLARGPWLFILFVCGILTGHMILALLPLGPEGPVKFSLIDMWPHVAAAGSMSIVFYFMAKRAKDVLGFQENGDKLRREVFPCLGIACNCCRVHHCGAKNAN